MQFILTTLGCKTNWYEAAALSGVLGELGFSSVSSFETAGVFILNSCTLTENSDRKTRQLLAAAKRRNPQMITVLTGCFPQAYPEKAKMLGADVVCGTSRRAELPALILEFMKTRTAIERIAPHSDVYEELNSFAFGERTRAFIKIQDGCDCDCAYCIVPAARGRPRSRPLSSVRAEAEASAAAGFKEIVLTGINLAKHPDLCSAVEAAAEHAARVRLSSLEPDLLTDDMLRRLALVKNLCPHFHLSLQSGSTSVLERMGRRYTADEYMALMQRIRLFFGDRAAFTTDMMVGFPGETDEEFLESLALARLAGFAKIHVFPFSPRPGTPAAVMDGQVPGRIKRERRDRLLTVAEELRNEFLDAQIGKTLSVLIEQGGFGHAENYAPVKVLGNTQQNEIINVKIINKGVHENVSSQNLYGEKV
jgi:threonylcarbamoyladenosine tRNA methylthiotransferase MtaB